jgi:uncharacterized protein (DUF302 family)
LGRLNSGRCCRTRGLSRMGQGLIHRGERVRNLRLHDSDGVGAAKEENMPMRKIEIERLTMTSSKPFEAVVAELEAAVGHPDMGEFMKAIADARTFAELEGAVGRSLGRTGLMMFIKFDLGAILRKETGLDTPKIVRLVIGNPLVMKEMAKHVPDAASYAPVTVLVDERPDGVHLSYDRMASLLAPYGNPDALAVARDLDAKIESLLRESAGRRYSQPASE